MINPEIVAQLREIHIGNLIFYGYGFIIALSVAIAFFLFNSLSHNEKVKSLLTPGLIVSIAVCMLIGGRLMSVLSDIEYYFSHPNAIVKTWEGGMSIFGVLIGIFAGYMLYKAITKHTVTVLEFLDTIVPFTALAQSLGRWANFVNQELYGPPTDVPWKMYISPQYRLSGYSEYEFFHPAFLYESIFTFGLFLFLLRRTRKEEKEHFPRRGLITGMYAMMYGLIRLAVNRFRIDADLIVGSIGITDVWALLLVIIGGLLIFRAYHGKNKRSLYNRS